MLTPNLRYALAPRPSPPPPVSKRKANITRKQAIADEAKPRTWRTTGILTPKDRELEANYQANLARIHEEVKELKRQSDECSAKGSRMVQQAQDILPKISSSLAAYKVSLRFACCSTALDPLGRVSSIQGCERVCVCESRSQPSQKMKGMFCARHSAFTAPLLCCPK